jgi:hypothetical protein
LLGGQMALYVEYARTAIETTLSQRLGVVW